MSRIAPQTSNQLVTGSEVNVVLLMLNYLRSNVCSHS